MPDDAPTKRKPVPSLADSWMGSHGPGVKSAGKVESIARCQRAPGLFESTWLFYLVVAVILAIAAVTVSVAKLRDWI
jgi:hypothetical protein